jgi:glucosamine-6-phosphate deaminase
MSDPTNDSRCDSEASPAEPALASCVFAERHEAELFLAREIAELAEEKRDEGGRAVLAFAAGRTPIGLYRELVRMSEIGEADFSDVIAFQLDEFVGIKPEHPGSFRCQLTEQLFEPAGFAPENLRLIRGEAPPEELAGVCRGYEDSIREVGGIDLAILGLGMNGHVAFNEPGSAADSRTREVDLADETRKNQVEVFRPAEPPRTAITMGVGTIHEARRLRLLAFGQMKAEVVHGLLCGAVGTELPASLLRGHPDAVVLLDRPASGRIRATV